ncbi:hypothetical protein BKA62DRAFT_694539 [Auriculariales sp. MPI-PUGE-AT-0066]|nr:hypothetical protein BKA62DRAFT_694539 [Auriculariales sp. MPI-PUGE-AT-0066]
MPEDAAMEVEMRQDEASERAVSLSPPPQTVELTTEPTDVPREPAAPPKPAVRPKLDFKVERAGGAGVRKRAGRTMFGVVLGTLNKAKIEDKERAASEAAKKRALIDQRLQSKIARETNSVRKQEEARSKRSAAQRKQDDLALKDSIIRSRLHRLPLLANFLLTCDKVPSNPDDITTNDDINGQVIDTKNLSEGTRSILDAPPRGHPPPLFFLPAVLLDSQRKFIERRKKEVETVLKFEWSEFREQRDSLKADIASLRAEAEASQQQLTAERAEATSTDAQLDVQMDTADAKAKGSNAGKPLQESSAAARADAEDAEDVRMDDAEPTKEGEDKVEY